jgi:hypothetical protein
MATVTISKRADGIVNCSTASWTGDAAAQTITLGFVPTYVLIVNETDVIRWEKIDPMAAANCLKTVTAGTLTLDATSAIVINTDGTLTLSAGLNATGKALKLLARRS